MYLGWFLRNVLIILLTGLAVKVILFTGYYLHCLCVKQYGIFAFFLR